MSDDYKLMQQNELEAVRVGKQRLGAELLTALPQLVDLFVVRHAI